MRFEERELKSYAEPVSATELREGSVYFSVTYADGEMLIPIMETLVFIGKDLEPGDSGQVYFQDIHSYRRGVRYGAAVENDHAQFSTGSEREVSHFFEYEHALEELMRCSVKRRERGGEMTPSAKESKTEGPLPQGSPSDMPTQSLRFDDAELQERFVAELRKSALVFELRSDGAATCTDGDWPSVNDVAGIIRDSCFPWYLVLWSNNTQVSYLFWQEMKALSLPFHVEHHEDRIAFLLPRGSEELHRAVIDRVGDATLIAAQEEPKHTSS